jgi:hypothetical protein
VTQLLAVWVRVESGEPFAELDAYYQTHIPRLCSLPPYHWGRRYFARPTQPVGGAGTAHLAIYGFGGQEHIPVYLGGLSDETPRLVRPELERWADLTGLTDPNIALLEQVGGPDFQELMSLDNDVVAEWSDDDTSRIPEQFEQSMSFTRLSHPVLAQLPGARRLSIALVPEDAGAEVRESLIADQHIEYLAPIAKHWSSWW